MTKGGGAYVVTPQFGLVESVAAAKLNAVSRSIIKIDADKGKGDSQHDCIPNPTSVPLRCKTPKSNV